MSSSSEKSKRKVLRIKRDAEAEAPAPEAGAPARIRRPVRGRHLPLRQQQAKKGIAAEAPPPAARDRHERPERPSEPRRRKRPDEAGRFEKKRYDAEGGEQFPHKRPSRGEAAGSERPARKPSDFERDRGERPPRKDYGKPAQERGPRSRPEQGEAPRRRHRPEAEARPERAPREQGRPTKSEQARQHPYFAPCPRGLEAELGRELTELGASDVVPGSGGAAFTGDIFLAWKVNLWSRLAIRVLQRVAHGRYRQEEDLYQAARDLPWPDWFPLGRTIAVRTVAHASPLKSLNFASLKVKDALCDRFRDVTRARPDVDARTPDVPILLYLERDEFSLYLDLTGEPLNRRGYRIEAAQAPLNENLAAGMLRLAGWTPDTPLLDPMMGGGTILLEAALMALNIAPGLRRHFAFENLNNFDRVEWARLRKDAQAAVRDKHPLPIYGCDLDPRMVHATETNLREAGLLDCVTLREADALEVKAPTHSGVIVSNPPYGVRLEHEDMAGFYRGLGDNLKQHFAGWNAYLLSADPELPQHIGLKATRRTPLYNGPLECRLYEYRMVAGQMRTKTA